MLIGVLGLAGGLTGVISTDNFLVELVGIAMTYGGFLLAYTGYEKWDDGRSAARHLSRCLPRLEGVLDRVSVEPADGGAIVGRFQSHWFEVTGSSELYQVRMVLDGAGGLTWALHPEGKAWHLKSRSRLLEEKLRRADVVRLVSERPEFKSFARRKCRWSVYYVAGHSCGEAWHATSSLTYSVKPRPHLWRDITDEELRGHLGLLIELAGINARVNAVKPDDVDPPAEPPKWLGTADTAVKAAVGLAVVVTIILLALKI